MIAKVALCAAAVVVQTLAACSAPIDDLALTDIAGAPIALFHDARYAAFGSGDAAAASAPTDRPQQPGRRSRAWDAVPYQVYRTAEPQVIREPDQALQLTVFGRFERLSLWIGDAEGQEIRRFDAPMPVLPESAEFAVRPVSLVFAMPAGTTLSRLMVTTEPADAFSTITGLAVVPYQGTAYLDRDVVQLPAGLFYRRVQPLRRPDVAAGETSGTAAGAGGAAETGTQPTGPADVVTGARIDNLQFAALFDWGGRIVPGNTIATAAVAVERTAPAELAVELWYRYDRSDAERSAIADAVQFDPPVAILEVRGVDAGTVIPVNRFDDRWRTRQLRVQLRPGLVPLYLYSTQIGFVPVEVTLSAENINLRLERADLYAPSAVQNDPLVPIPVDLGTLLDYPRELWRRDNFEIFSWSLYPGIIWVDSRDYAVQNRLFARLAFFVEKDGYRGRLLTNEELRGLHAWNAHNYRPEGLAAFYNAARAAQFVLNDEEIELLRILLLHGILVDGSGTYREGTGGILGVTQDPGGSRALRELLITHEAWHGVFYVEPAFVQRVQAHWDALADDQRAFWTTNLQSMSYDPDDPYLMVNEMQAYVLQQRMAAVDWYFNSRTIDRLVARFPEDAAGLRELRRRYPNQFVEAGLAFNRAALEITGLVGGEVGCLATTAIDGP